MSIRAERPRAASSAAAATLLAAVALQPTAAQAATNVWTTPVTVGDAPVGVQPGLVTRVGLTANGKGTVSWNVAGDGTIAARDFTVGGSLEPAVTVTKGGLVGAVARDAAGNAVISGQSAGAPATSWVVTRAAAPGTSWTFRALASGGSVGAPAAFGLKSGFLIASTSSFIPKTAAEGVPTAAAFGFTATGASVPLGKELSQVETGDFSHGGDGSNWAVTSDGQAVTSGRRETSKAKNGVAPKSVAALIKVGKDQTRNSILGAERFGGGSVSTAGQSIGVAGLDVQQTNEIAVRGIPVIAQGTVGSVGETVEIGGVPARRALEVDVAERAGGEGAVVTWLQQTSSTAENLLGQPKWAVVDGDGEVTARGAFSSITDARDLRVVRAGSSEIAVWIRGTGTKARFGAAKITGETVRLVKAPAGAPLGRLEASLNTSQLTSNGRQVALSFVDTATSTVKVATQTLK